MKSEYALGIDIGGTRTKFGICSVEGKVVYFSDAPTPANEDDAQILSGLKKIIQISFKEAQRLGVQILAVGVGSPGRVDINRGKLLGGTPNFTYWKDVEIAAILGGECSVPVYVDNDANLMSFGEYRFGDWGKPESLVCLTLGTGVGSGFIQNGRIFRGAFFGGPEFGHMSIVPDGLPCNCGGRGCWEKYVSASALVADYLRINPQNPAADAREIFQRFASGEYTARDVIYRTVDYLGIGISNIMNILNPEIILVGGGLAEAGEWFIQKIEESAREKAIKGNRNQTRIARVANGLRSGVLGAAAWALKIIRR